MRRYVPEHERQIILVEAHGGVDCGNYVGKATAHKVLRSGLWWPKLHNDAKDYFQECDACQNIGKPSRRDEFY